MPKTPDPNKSVATFGPAHNPVRIYHLRTRDIFQICWTSDGPKIKQRKSKDDALALAKEIGRKLSRSRPGTLVQSLSPADQQILKLIRSAPDTLDVQQLLKDAIAEHNRQKIDVTIAELCQRMRAHADTLAKSTRTGILSRLNVIERDLGHIFLNSLTEADIIHWRDTTLTTAPRTRNNHVEMLSTMINQAKRWKLCAPDFNPAADAGKAKTIRQEPATWTPQTLRNILAYLQDNRPDLIPYIALGAFAGMRPTEIAGVPGERHGLLWSDIDFQNQHVRIRADVAGKKREARYIQFNNRSNTLTDSQASSCRDALFGWLSIDPESSDIALPQHYQKLKSSRRIIYTRGQDIVSKTLRSAGIIDSWPADVLRHSFISYYLALTNNRDHTAELAGNTPQIIRTNYRAPVPLKVAEEWFSIIPATTESKIIRLAG